MTLENYKIIVNSKRLEFIKNVIIIKNAVDIIFIIIYMICNIFALKITK